MFKKIIIGSTERGVLYYDKQFVKILGSGTYRYFMFNGKYTVEVFDIAKATELKGSIVKLLSKIESAKIDSFLEKVTTTSRETAVVYKNSQAFAIVSPGEERLFWKGLEDISVKKFNIAESYELDRETIRDISLILNDRDILSVKVPEQYRGLLFESGVLVGELNPGSYAFWRSQRDLNVSVLDTRLTALDVSGQEMLTKDKVTLRVNLSVSYRLLDAAMAVRSLNDIQGEIYRTAQLSLRQAVGEKSLDELLENKEVLNKLLANELDTTISKFGIEISRVGVKDIILPGDMRLLFNQVVEAEKAAQSQNIRRREETAATRSLLNTARLMENNPVLLRLKELEAVERISEKVEKLTVYDGLKGVVNGMVSLKD